MIFPGYEDGPTIEIISYDQTSLRKHDIIPNLQGVTVKMPWLALGVYQVEDGRQVGEQLGSVDSIEKPMII